jgi:hypothetical protein
MFSLVGDLPQLRGLAYSDHFGGASNAGLYMLSATGQGVSQISSIPPAQALGAQPFSPSTYAAANVEWHSVSATPDGKLLVGGSDMVSRISDLADQRLSFAAWLDDEFRQVVRFAKGLISPDGEPQGWVIDGDVQLGWMRFHPATPDAAGWAVLLLMMSEQLTGDPEAQALVRQILVRYAGLAADGIRPSLSVDGVMRHWMDPLTGQAKSGWDPEFATLSTEAIVLAASRAKTRYPADSVIQQAAAKLICQVHNQSAYFQSGTDAVYLKGLVGGGPDLTSASRPFNESSSSPSNWASTAMPRRGAAYSRWLERWRWPTATFLAGRPITGDVAGQFQSAFTSLYPLLVQPAFRSSSDWQAQIAAVRDSNGAWTDDNGPRFTTVFSAGTTKAEWGGYHADNLLSHPGDVTSFPALIAFGGAGRWVEAVGAYNAYRRGARQTFLTGASILYRRSNVEPGYQPNSAGLPDVALGWARPCGTDPARIALTCLRPALSALRGLLRQLRRQHRCARAQRQRLLLLPESLLGRRPLCELRHEHNAADAERERLQLLSQSLRRRLPLTTRSFRPRGCFRESPAALAAFSARSGIADARSC